MDKQFNKIIMDINSLVSEWRKAIVVRNIKLFGFDVKDKFNQLSYDIQRVISYLCDGIIGDYKLEKGWLWINEKDINKEKAIQLKFKPYKGGYVKKVFKNKQFIFKIT